MKCLPGPEMSISSLSSVTMASFTPLPLLIATIWTSWSVPNWFEVMSRGQVVCPVYWASIVTFPAEGGGVNEPCSL